MIARQDSFVDRTDVWSKLSAPLPAGVISWRQDGKPIDRDGRAFARFVCYIEASTVRERLDSAVPGEWDLTLELLPSMQASHDSDALCAFKARLQVLGVIREDVGTGRDYKQAATDAFKRAAVRFGIGHELYAYEQNWVEMEGDDQHAKPLEDPQHAYQRRYGHEPQKMTAGRVSPVTESMLPSVVTDVDAVSCPKCGSRMWDNRLTKRNPKAPDFKCRDRNCDGVLWPHRSTQTEETAQQAKATEQSTAPEMEYTTISERSVKSRVGASVHDDDELPF